MTNVLASNAFITHVGEIKARRRTVKGHTVFHVMVNLECEITLRIMSMRWNKEFYLSVLIKSVFS